MNTIEGFRMRSMCVLGCALCVLAPGAASAQNYTGEAIVAFDCTLDRLVVHDVSTNESVATLPLFVREGIGVDHETIGGARELSLRQNTLAFTSSTSFTRQLFPLNVWTMDLATGGPEIATGFAAGGVWGTVNGVVKDPHGRPVEGATVRAHGSLGTDYSDAQGRFELAVPLGDVTVFAYGYDGAQVDAWGKGEGTTVSMFGDTVTQDVTLTTTFSNRYGFGQPSWSNTGSLYMSLYGPIGNPAVIPTGKEVYSYNPAGPTLTKIAPQGNGDLGLCGFSPSPNGASMLTKPLYGGVELVNPSTFATTRQLLDSVEAGPACAQVAWRSNTQVGAVARLGGALKKPVLMNSNGSVDLEVAYPPDTRLGWGTDVWAFSPGGRYMLLTDGGRRFRIVDVAHQGSDSTRPYSELDFDCDANTPGVQSCPNICSATWGQVTDLNPHPPASFDLNTARYSVGPNSIRIDYDVPVNARGERPDTYQVCIGKSAPTSVREHCRVSEIVAGLEVNEPAGAPDYLEIGGLDSNTTYHITMWPHDEYLGSEDVMYVTARTLAPATPPQNPGAGGSATGGLDPDDMTDPVEDPFELDAGMDAGGMDAGGMDAGGMDAGGMDAGDVDAGGVDAGDVDAGGVDAGGVDAGGVLPDAGGVDAGAPASDAGVDLMDTGEASDAGASSPDSSQTPLGPVESSADQGCSSASSGRPAGAAMLLLMLVALFTLRSRTRRGTRRCEDSGR